MKKIFCISLLFILATQLRAQKDSLQSDSLVPDTFAIPAISLFTSEYYFFFFLPAVPLDATCELRIADHLSLSISGHYIVRGFRSRYIDPFGYGFGLEPRYYFLKKNVAYIGVNVRGGISKQSATLEFEDVTGIYFKRSRITTEYVVINPMFGWNGGVNTKIKYPIGFALGFQVGFRNDYYTNLDQHDLDLVREKKVSGGIATTLPLGFMVTIWTPIGWVIKR